MSAPDRTALHGVLGALVSRRTSLVLMAFVAVSGAIGAWLPQRANLSPQRMAAWESAHPALARVAKVTGFDHLFSTWWFLVALAVFAVILLIALVDMVRAVLGRHAALVPHGSVENATLSEIGGRAEAAGYRRRRGSGDRLRYVRHDAGAWGATVLHLGMLVALTAGLAASAMTSRAVLDLSQGESRTPGDAYLAVEPNVFGEEPDLGVPVRFDGVLTESWPSGEIKAMTAMVSLLEKGEWVPYSSSVNEPLRYQGNTVYVQPADFGEAAFLLVTTASGTTHRLRMEFPHLEEGEAGYSSVAVDGRTVLHGRWDPHGVKGEALLALRPDADASAMPVSLSEGAPVQVGEYTVELVSTGQWARFIIVRPRAIGVLFAGFAIIAAGSLMLYLYVPREIVLEEADGMIRYGWRAARFGASYLCERDAILGDDGGED